MPDTISKVSVPRLNANDEFVRLVALHIQDGQTVKAGDVVAEVETAKATTEIEAAAGGVIVFVAEVDAQIEIGATIAYIGPTREAIDAHRKEAEAARKTASATAAQSITPKARKLIEKHGIDPSDIPAKGSIKIGDVEAYIAARGGNTGAVDRPSGAGRSIPSAVRAGMVDDGPLSDHQRNVISNLRRTVEAGIFTTLDFTLDLSGANQRIERAFKAGRRTSLLALFLKAAAATLPRFPLLLSITDGTSIWRHASLDIAFVARALDGRLYTPVIRGLDALPLADVTLECARLSKKAMKNALAGDDMGTAALTVSLIPVPGVKRFKALPAPHQASIIAIGAPFDDIRADKDGALAAHPAATATVTYDHSLCDGIYIADFMAALNKTLNADEPSDA